VLLKDLLLAYRYGLKTLYYQNTRDGQTDSQTQKSGTTANPTTVVIEDAEDDCAGGACKI